MGWSMPVAAAPVAGNGLVGSGSVLAPVETILNQAVLQTHATWRRPGIRTPCSTRRSMR